MKHARRIYGIFLPAILCLFFISHTAHARILLLDGTLELSGYAREYSLIRTHIPRQEQQFHKSNMDMSLSSFLVEGLCRITDRYDLTVNLFAGFRYWYEKAPVFDADLRHGIPSQVRSAYAHPHDAEYIKEAYLDISSGSLRLTTMEVIPMSADWRSGGACTPSSIWKRKSSSCVDSS